jgi:ATP phosphoribosyltransferase
MSGAIRLAVPNKGRLKDPSVQLLRDAGLSFELAERTLSVRMANVDLDLLFVRTEDVAELVADGVADLGITGQDLLAEFGARLPPLLELGYGHCRLVAAVPKESPAEKVDDFAGFRVATAHPRTTEDFFRQRGITITAVPLRGSVEVAPKLGIADGIVDLVSSGSTLLLNGLRPVDTIITSQAVLVVNPEALATRSGDLQQVATMLRAVVAARGKRYLLLNAPLSAAAAIEALIPGLESPSLVPLAEQGMVAVHSVVDADDIWRLLPELKAAGGSGILVLPIEQLIP